MILFGAGSSVPFGIPSMIGFTEQYKKQIEGLKRVLIFVNEIEEAIKHSQDTIGTDISFDLETLMSVLIDLSGNTNKSISPSTASFLITKQMNIREAREKFKDTASSGLGMLRNFIFDKCMEPIKRGKEDGNYQFLDIFYGPLMTILNRQDLNVLQDSIRNIFSTNWDICFKTWADYINVKIDDGTALDRQSLPVLDVSKFDPSMKSSDGFTYVPLHGSLDIIKIFRIRGEGMYHDIFKISDPIRYFQDKPDNIKDIFIIYPLEAIGYEESVKSPYLEMLYRLRKIMEDEYYIFIIGSSLREPTIGSIFEEALTVRIRRGDIKHLPSDIELRKAKAHENRLNIIVINPNAKKIEDNLKKQFRTNLQATFYPIEIKFPEISDPEFKTKYSQELSKILNDLEKINYISPDQKKMLIGMLREKYSLPT